MDELNRSVFLALNASAAPPAASLVFAIVCAKYLYFAVPAHIALVWLGGTRSMRFVAISGALAMAIALAASGLVGLLAYTPRPSMIGLGHTFLDHRPSAAFPSNHAIVCLSWAMTLAIFGRIALATAGFVLALLVAWSRIYVGVHFPLDMLGAVLFSGLAAAAATVVMIRRGELLVACADRLHARIPLLGRA